MIPEITAIYDPVSREMLLAKSGKGARLNGVKINCSKRKKLEDTVGLMSSVIYPEDYDRWNLIIGLGKKRKFFLNVFGSCSKNAYAIARGSKDWHVSFDRYIWDIMPAIHVMEEAGCKVTNLEGKKWRPGDFGFVAANKYLHKRLMEVLNKK